jgi:hypothetical protein
MIMSYLAKVEMSYSTDAILLLFLRRQDGRRGHYHGTTEGVKTVACDSQSYRWESYSARGSFIHLLEPSSDTTYRRTH